MKTLTKDQYECLQGDCGDACPGTCSYDRGPTYIAGKHSTGDTLVENGYLVIEECRASGATKHYYHTALAKQAMACYEFASKVIEGALT